MTTTSMKQGRRKGEGNILRRAVVSVRDSVTGSKKFIRQVVSELKKVVRPTRSELITYTSVLLVFVVLVMTYISVLDYGFGQLVLRVFGGASS